VAIQSDQILLSTLIVAPTSTSAQPAVFRPEIEMDGTRTRVLVDQMRAVDGSRLGDFAGRLASMAGGLDRLGQDPVSGFEPLTVRLQGALWRPIAIPSALNIRLTTCIDD
jgi:PemK-like, MazF-like toxin of type II toxin-antitoxin system